MIHLAAVLLLVGDVQVLENEHVRVTIDPAKGGAVTSMVLKKAATFALIADKGAGIAGTGSLFALPGTPALSADPARSKGEEAVLRLTGTLGGGVTVERTFRMATNESGFRWTDTYASEGPAIAVGAESRQAPEKWRLCGRSVFGDATGAQTRSVEAGTGEVLKSECKSAPLFWRQVGTLGTGFLYQANAPAGAAVVHEIPKGPGAPFSHSWTASVAAKSASIESSVLIDQDGGEVNLPGTDRVIVSLEARAAGSVGETMPAQVRVVSVLSRDVRLELQVGEKKSVVPLKLEAGRAKFHLFDVVPAKAGPLDMTAELADGLGRAAAKVLVDMDGEASKLFARKIPVQVYKGSWAEIGAQLSKVGRLKAKPADARAAERLAFYEKHFPYYAELIRGAAQALKVTPEQLALTGAEGRVEEACMNVFFNGPDGPINGFSKERERTGLGGLAYMKVLPDKGYAYHVYECGSWQNGYGVNSEGLSTTGASINCDGATTTVGRRELQQWKASGKVVAPLGSHLMLATCKDVEEAIRFIENPLAPFEFEGNMMLVDRAGNAARLESVGIRRQIHRYVPAKDGPFFVAGNYPHENDAGLFKIGSDWGWAANTMLRERLLFDLAGERQGKLSLKDAAALMETHAAGGMCQHGLENPGRLYTSNSYLAVTRTSELWLSHGPPCKFRYYRFSLKDPE